MDTQVRSQWYRGYNWPGPLPAKPLLLVVISILSLCNHICNESNSVTATAAWINGWPIFHLEFPVAPSAVDEAMTVAAWLVVAYSNCSCNPTEQMDGRQVGSTVAWESERALALCLHPSNLNSAIKLENKESNYEIHSNIIEQMAVLQLSLFLSNIWLAKDKSLNKGTLDWATLLQLLW